MLLDKHVAERDRCEMEAETMLFDADDPLPCFVSDMSDHGACLVVTDDISKTPRFELLLPVILQIDDRRSFEVRWQRDPTLGVCFDRS